MSARVVRHPLLPVAAVAASLTNGSAIGAEWTLMPSAGLSTEARQNSRLAVDPEQQDETVTGAGAQAALSVRGRTERLDFAIQPSFRAHRYPDDGSLDRTEQQLDLSLGWQGEKISWTGSAAASRDTTLTSELGTTGLTQVNLRHESYRASLGPAWRLSERMTLRSVVSSELGRYPEGERFGLEDFRYGTASVDMSYGLGERCGVSLSASTGRLRDGNVGGGTDSSGITVQVQYALSPVWSVLAAAGPSWVRAEGGGQRERSLLYRIDTSRSFERATLSLGVSRSQSPAGRALLTQVEQATLSLGAQLGERLSGSLTAGVSRRTNSLRQFDLDLQKVQYRRIQAALSWTVSPSWQLGMALGNSVQRVGSDFFRDSTGRGYDASLTLGWRGRTYVN